MADIVGICWGNCTKLSYLMCPHRGIKCMHLILGVLLPKNFGAENVVFNYAILRLYCKYLQSGRRYRRPENGVATTITPVYMPTKFGELWSTNGEDGTVFQPTQNQLLDAHIWGLTGVVP